MDSACPVPGHPSLPDKGSPFSHHNLLLCRLPLLKTNCIEKMRDCLRGHRVTSPGTPGRKGSVVQKDGNLSDRNVTPLQRV